MQSNHHHHHHHHHHPHHHKPPVDSFQLGKQTNKTKKQKNMNVVLSEEGRLPAPDLSLARDGCILPTILYFRRRALSTNHKG
ncbi:hypothetical protein EYF80_019692 [Liparis tanakae]|uniref:Uncharacterized protein n=1 Tax=Liparis tanakae TaxID=230148 RepID=A0A4Z2HVY8_9TELE|nr:hypothetical protein EYF80_019692 [Liparis tanakae]